MIFRLTSVLIKCIINYERGTNKEEKTMYEVVKVIKGYEIVRMKGTHGAYHVNVREGMGFREFHTFRTIKAAVEFIKNVL